MKKFNSSHYREFTNLDQWLYYLEKLHSSEIDLGLSRIGQVAQRLAIDFNFAKVITVAGTNGKGTTCAFIENALLNNDAKQSVAVYSSPHIEHFNERLRINKESVEDAVLIEAFIKIEVAREDISLSYYEYTTLAAFLVLMCVMPHYIILEVGLGGRLDATNIIDADIAVITTIDLDHQNFLGNDRESIGFEKAGIMRKEQIIVVGDINPPKSVLAHAKTLQACSGQTLFVRNQDFLVNSQQLLWCWKSKGIQLDDLELPFIPQDNVATGLMVLATLGLALTKTFTNEVIAATKVAGRTELIKQSNQCDVILDVGHNPQATRYLANYLRQIKKKLGYQNIYGVISMLSDKDIKSSIEPLKNEIDFWYSGVLDVPRAASKERMKSELLLFAKDINCFDNVNEAFKMANEKASPSDLILVFGSFFTVAQIRSQLVIY
jgi:dihydrofolate synthase/folylpolyglutamate synthase